MAARLHTLSRHLPCSASMATAATTTSFKLTYLPVRARAENIRMMLKFADSEYEDEIVAGAAWQAPPAAIEVVLDVLRPRQRPRRENDKGWRRGATEND